MIMQDSECVRELFCTLGGLLDTYLLASASSKNRPGTASVPCQSNIATPCCPECVRSASCRCVRSWSGDKSRWNLLVSCLCDPYPPKNAHEPRP